jgi:hypothetical protein
LLRRTVYGRRISRGLEVWRYVVILTVNGLAGVTGLLGTDERHPDSMISAGYARGVLGALAVLAVIISVVGVTGAAVNVFRNNATMTIISFIIAIFGFYALIGILKEMRSLEILTRYTADLSPTARASLVRQMIADNNKSIFNLVIALLGSIERIAGTSANK